ncbi:YecA family protein [Tatlockia sp. PL877]|nr:MULTISPECIES: YecA family protein [unclassified Legionella]MDI9818970.1 YecA family protein [Legionella sp. PL877]
MKSTPLHLPAYDAFVDAISMLSLPVSGSELHGVMCGYLCAGAPLEGEAYLRALTVNSKREEETRVAALAMFDVFAISQQQLANFDFTFQLLLPDETESLMIRAQAFGEWCEGFAQGMTMAGIGHEQLHEEESQEALHHILEFAQLDYEALEVEEEDEKALVEVSEYARMAVLRIYEDLLQDHDSGNMTH